MRDLHRFYEQGKLAYITAGNDARCPYPQHSDEYIEWSYGYMRAMTADEIEGHPV